MRECTNEKILFSKKTVSKNDIVDFWTLEERWRNNLDIDDIVEAVNNGLLPAYRYLGEVSSTEARLRIITEKIEYKEEDFLESVFDQSFHLGSTRAPIASRRRTREEIQDYKNGASGLVKIYENEIERAVDVLGIRGEWSSLVDSCNHVTEFSGIIPSDIISSVYNIIERINNKVELDKFIRLNTDYLLFLKFIEECESILNNNFYNFGERVSLLCFLNTEIAKLENSVNAKQDDRETRAKNNNERCLRKGNKRKPVSQREAAKMLGISERTLRKLEKTGGYPEGYPGRDDAIVFAQFATRFKERKSLEQEAKRMAGAQVGRYRDASEAAVNEEGQIDER